MTTGKQYKYVALAQQVLAVASINHDVGDWAAYVDAVRGVSHGTEWQRVAAEGAKLLEGVAAVLWPDLAENYVWRR